MEHLLLLVQGSLTESDLLSAARYTAWNRSIHMKIMLALGCVLMLIGVVTIVVGQAGYAVVPLLVGGFYTAYFFGSPKLSVKKQLKASAHVSQEGFRPHHARSMPKRARCTLYERRLWSHALTLYAPTRTPGLHPQIESGHDRRLRP